MSDFQLQNTLIKTLRQELTASLRQLTLRGQTLISTHNLTSQLSINAQVSHLTLDEKGKSEVEFILRQHTNQFSNFFNLQLDKLFNILLQPNAKSSIEFWYKLNHPDQSTDLDIDTFERINTCISSATQSYQVHQSAIHKTLEEVFDISSNDKADPLHPRYICSAYLLTVKCCSHHRGTIDYFLLLFLILFVPQLEKLYAIFAQYQSKFHQHQQDLKKFILSFNETDTEDFHSPFCLKSLCHSAQLDPSANDQDELDIVTLDNYLFQIQRAQITYIQDHHKEYSLESRDIRSQLTTMVNTLSPANVISNRACAVLDIVGHIFELLHDDHLIHNDLKQYLHTLQAFYSRVALKIPAFLHKPNHVTRLLLLDLIELAERLSQASHSNYHASMLSVLKDSLFQICSTKNITLSQIKHLHDRFHKNLHCDAQTNKVDLDEKLNTPTKKAQHLVSDIINMRIQHYQFEPTILKIVKDAWFHYLILTYLQKGPKSKAWKNGLSTLDTLLWCARTKSHETEQAYMHWKSCVAQVRRKLFICLSEVRFNEHRLNTMMENYDRFFAQQKYVIKQNT